MNLPSLSPSEYESAFPKEKLQGVTGALQKLTPVEGLKEAFEILKGGGVQVWAVSNGACSLTARKGARFTDWSTFYRRKIDFCRVLLFCRSH